MACYTFLLPSAKIMRTWQGKRTSFGERTTKEKCGPKPKLSLPDQFFMVLVRLHLGRVVEDLADCFYVSPSTVSRTFTTYGEMKRHRTLGITRSFCDLFVWEERKTSSGSSSGKYSHCAHPETNSWHPCQCFKTKKKAHNRKLTVPDYFVLQPREPAYFTYKSGMKWQKSKLGAARSEDDREISIVRRRKETQGALRSSVLQTVLL